MLILLVVCVRSGLSVYMLIELVVCVRTGLSVYTGSTETRGLCQDWSVKCMLIVQ